MTSLDRENISHLLFVSFNKFVDDSDKSMSEIKCQTYGRRSIHQALSMYHINKKFLSQGEYCLSTFISLTSHYVLSRELFQQLTSFQPLFFINVLR